MKDSILKDEYNNPEIKLAKVTVIKFPAIINRKLENPKVYTG